MTHNAKQTNDKKKSFRRKRNLKIIQLADLVQGHQIRSHLNNPIVLISNRKKTFLY